MVNNNNLDRTDIKDRWKEIIRKSDIELHKIYFLWFDGGGIFYKFTSMHNDEKWKFYEKTKKDQIIQINVKNMIIFLLWFL